MFPIKLIHFNKEHEKHSYDKYKLMKTIHETYFIEYYSKKAYIHNHVDFYNL